jgi:hypothetical protein
VPFFFRRQPVFYRSAHPVGSIIIDKQQHFLYLIRPNQVALRYGIGVGKSCAGVAGLHKVAGKKEWPEWQPPADMIERKLAPAGVMKGEPGNPLGARIIVLDDGSLSIHGTNAPKTIGSSVDFGCIRLANDDAVFTIAPWSARASSFPTRVSRSCGPDGARRSEEGNRLRASRVQHCVPAMLRPHLLKIAEERGRESCPAADRATIGIARLAGLPRCQILIIH